MFCDKYYFVTYIVHMFKFFNICCLKKLINLNIKLINITLNKQK